MSKFKYHIHYMEITQESMNEYLHKTRTYDTIYATYEQVNENKKIN